MSSKTKKGSIVWNELIFSSLLLIITIVLIVATKNYKPQSSRVPLFILYPLAAMLLGQIIFFISKIRREKRVIEFNTGSDAFRKMSVLLISLVAFLILIYLTGHIVGIAIFLIIFLKFVSKQKWLLTIISGIAVPVFLYVVFQVIFHMSFYPGILARYF